MHCGERTSNPHPSKKRKGWATRAEHKFLPFVAAGYENPNHLVRRSSHVGAVLRTSVPRFAPKGHYRELGELLGLLRWKEPYTGLLCKQNGKNEKRYRTFGKQIQVIVIPVT